MPFQFIAQYIEEPDLVFGDQREEKDPKIGLKYLGPYQYPEEKDPSPNKIRVGIIGNAVTLTLTKQMLDLIRSPIASPRKNKWLYPDFPGFNVSTTIKCEFTTSKNWEVTITEHQIREVLEITDSVNRRIAKGVNLYKEGVRTINADDDPPDVIICSLPYDIEEYCGISEKTREAKRPKFTPLEKERARLKADSQTFMDDPAYGMPEPEETEDNDLDFHNALKGKVMEFKIPVQLLRESALRGMLRFGEPGVKVTQEPATFAWNLGTALYYKSNGKPWRLAKLRTDTCYIGISFFHNKLNPDNDIETSMAQVFTHNGQGIVLRGKDVVVDQKTRQAHMSEKQFDFVLKIHSTYTTISCMLSMAICV